MNPYEPPQPQKPKDQSSILVDCFIGFAIGAFAWVLIWLFVPTTKFWFPIKFGLSMFASIPMVLGLVYGLANLLFGQEEF